MGGMAKELGSREGLLAAFSVQAEGNGGVGVGRDLETWARPAPTATLLAPQPPCGARCLALRSADWPPSLVPDVVSAVRKLTIWATAG